jgi:MFS family permease
MPQFVEHFGETSEVSPSITAIPEPIAYGRRQFLRGFIVAVILIPSALTGLIAGSLMDRISRKYTISLGCALFAVGAAMCAFQQLSDEVEHSLILVLSAAASPNIPTLIVARCIAGSGEGFFLSAATCYICEISPKEMRGEELLLSSREPVQSDGGDQQDD